MSDSQLKEAQPKGETRFLIRLLAIWIPSIATTFGLVTWALINFNILGPRDGDAPPNSKLAIPVTQQQTIPELPYDDINDGLYPLEVSVDCQESSAVARWALSCSDVSGSTFEPCFYPATDGEPYSVYCFDPAKFKYEGFSVDKWVSPSSVSDGNLAIASYVFIRVPEVNNIYDYATETINIGGFQYDICSIVPPTNTAPEKSDYTCATGSKIVGGIQGDRPHYFAKYIDNKTNTSSVEWIGWIVYG